MEADLEAFHRKEIPEDLEGEIPEGLKDDGKLLPYGLWSLRQLVKHEDLFRRLFPEKIGEHHRQIWEIDWRKKAEQWRIGLTDWPDLPEEGQPAPEDLMSEAWDACADLVEGRAVGDALTALTEFEAYFSAEIEAAEREIERLRDEGDEAPGVKKLRRRVTATQTNYSWRRHAITRFRRKFATTFQVPDMTGEDKHVPPTGSQITKAQAVLVQLKKRGKAAFGTYSAMQARLEMEGLPEGVPTGEAVTKGAKRAVKRLGYGRLDDAQACWEALEDACDKGLLQKPDKSGQI